MALVTTATTSVPVRGCGNKLVYLLPIADKEESYWMVGYIMLASLASRCKLKSIGHKG